MLNIQNLAKSLEKSLELKVASRMLEVAERKRDAAINAAKDWKADVWGLLGRTRAYTPYSRKALKISEPGKFDFPYMVSGNLRRAVQYRTSKITHSKGSNTWSFYIVAIFNKVSAKSDGRDYSEILDNTPNRYYSNYKERLTNRLQDTINKIIRTKGNGIYN